MIELDSLTIAEASRLLDSGALGASELIEATLRRVEETEPLVHAYVCVLAEEARTAAKAADARGRRGPLHGIPFGVKDLLETHDAPTEAGSRVLAGHWPRRDATAVRRLREAGAILVGKHVTHEFACGQNVPPTRNPWNLTHYPGGSSAGGGVSVAVGSSLAALGTDAGGSVRKPACVTATVGLKPTHGRVSGAGTISLASASSLDHVGTFTRTVEDCALVLQAIAGYDPAAPSSLDEPVPDYRATLGAGVAGLRLGIEPDFFGAAEPEILALFEEALRELERQGAVLVGVELPLLRFTLPALFTIFPAEVAVSHRRTLAERPHDYEPATRRLLELGTILPASHLEAARRAQAAIRAEVASVFREARLDALVTPTLPCTSLPLDEMEPARDLPKQIPFTSCWNLTGQPALSVPCGFTADGLPAGLQIVGRPLDEAMTLRVGHAYERATPWHERRPALASAAQTT